MSPPPGFCWSAASLAFAFAGESVFWSAWECIFAASAPDCAMILFWVFAVTPCPIISPIEAAALMRPHVTPTIRPMFAAERWSSAWFWIAFCMDRFSAVRISRAASRCDCATSIISIRSA